MLLNIPNTKHEYSNQKYFHTSIGGDIIWIQIYANGVGDGEGMYVSVFTQLLKGHYDNQLLWLFMGTVTYELLNQLEDNIHHSMEITHDASHDMTVRGNCYGYHIFVSHSSLGHNPATNMQYLLGDALYFRVSVKVACWCNGKL